jgi:hypothetical protein
MIINLLAVAGILFLIGLLVYGLCRAAARGDRDEPNPGHTGLFGLVDEGADGPR